MIGGTMQRDHRASSRRRRVALAAAVSLVAVGVVACTPVPQPAPAPAPARLSVSANPASDPLVFYTDVVDNYYETVDFTITNVGGQSTGYVFFTMDLDPPYDFSFGISRTECSPLAPGQSCVINVNYNPYPVHHDIDFGTITVYSTPGGSVSFDAVGVAGPSLTFSPDPPTVTDSVSGVGPTSTVVTVTNWTDGPVGPLSFTAYTDPRDPVTFGIGGTTCNAPIPGGGTCTVEVTLEATAPGSSTAGLLVEDAVLGLRAYVYPRGVGIP